MLTIALLAAAIQGLPVCLPEDHGGRAGDDALDTSAIQAAVDACAGTGGTVVLGPGRWEAAQVTLGSRMTFKLAAGATYALIPDAGLYEPLPGQEGTEANHVKRPAIQAFGVEGLRVEGPGRVLGRGEAFWDEGFLASGRSRPSLPRAMPMLHLEDCRGVVVDGLTIHASPGYGVAFTGCDGVRALDVTVRNDARSPNTDGIQVRDSRNVFIERADINTGDDAIVLKSHGAVVENVVVTDSVLRSDDAAIKFGTGSRVGVRNAVFTDTVIRDSRYGIAIFAIDGGTHRDVRFDGLLVETGGRHARTYPVFVDVDRREADRDWSVIDGLTLEGLDVRTDGAALIAGNPASPIRNLVLRDVNVRRRDEPEDLSRAGGKPRGNARIAAQDGSRDYARVPADLVIAHADGVVLDGVALPPCAGGRVGIALIDVTGLTSDEVPARAPGLVPGEDDARRIGGCD